MRERTLTYWTLHGDTEYHRLEGKDHPELAARVAFLSFEEAKVAAKDVLLRELGRIRVKIKENNSDLPADSAKVAYENVKQAACATQHRITYYRLVWDMPEDHGEGYYKGPRLTLEIGVEHRHRWHHAQQVVRVRKDGSSTITHGFVNPSPWTPWRCMGDGWHSPPTHVSVKVQQWTLALFGDGPVGSDVVEEPEEKPDMPARKKKE